jgi:hypothetical protein
MDEPPSYDNLSLLCQVILMTTLPPFANQSPGFRPLLTRQRMDPPSFIEMDWSVSAATWTVIVFPEAPARKLANPVTGFDSSTRIETSLKSGLPRESAMATTVPLMSVQFSLICAIYDPLLFLFADFFVVFFAGFFFVFFFDGGFGFFPAAAHFTEISAVMTGHEALIRVN